MGEPSHRRRIEAPNQPFHRFLEDAAEHHPDRIVIRFEDETLTAREWRAAAARYARAMTKAGVAIGDRVAICAATRMECPIAQQALSMAGAASVLVNSSWKAHELNHAFSITRPTAVIADTDMANTMVASGVALPPIRLCLDGVGPAGWIDLRDAAADESDARTPELPVADFRELDVLLPFSSGTTGLPKAVRHSHYGMVVSALTRVRDNHVSADDRLQYFMPLFTIFGVGVFSVVLATGASIRLLKRFDAAAVLQNFQDERITLGFATGPVALALRDQPLEQYDLSSVRYLLWGGTPVMHDVVADITRRSGLRWLIAYGTTECNIAVNLGDRPDTWRLDTPGPPMSGTEVKVVDPETLEELPRGEKGELWVRSPGVMRGYLPEGETSDVLRPDGWYRTGDICWLEDNDWIHITDRLKEMIKSRGFQVAPAELEAILFEHPAVADCAVYGVPDDRRGEAPCAAVVVAPGALDVSAADIQAFVAERAASYKHLAAVTFVAEIPRNAGGKILRRVLQADHR